MKTLNEVIKGLEMTLKSPCEHCATADRCKDGSGCLLGQSLYYLKKYRDGKPNLVEALREVRGEK